MSIVAENTYLEVHDGTPPANGMYVAFVNGEYIETYAARELLMWINGQWGYRKSAERYRGHVYGWIGPLPALPLTDGGHHD